MLVMYCSLLCMYLWCRDVLEMFCVYFEKLYFCVDDLWCLMGECGVLWVNVVSYG